MNILLVSPAVSPPPGGIATLTEGLVTSLEAMGRVRLLGYGGSPSRSGSRRILPMRAGRLGQPGSRLTFAAVVLISALWQRPDVVHGLTWRSVLPIAFLPRRFRPVLVVHCLGSELLRTGRFTAWLRNTTLRRADGAIAISRYTAGAVHALTGVSCAVIPPSVPEALALGRAPRESGGAVRVLSVGRLVQRKGHQRLVEAVALARNAGADLHLTIAGGDGDDALALLELSDRHDWLSTEISVSADRLAELYEQADVFALLTSDRPREFEGFGIVFVEASLHELPVIAGRSGGAQEVIEHGRGGYIVASPVQAADALIVLCHDESFRRSMGVAARTNAQQFLPAPTEAALRRFYTDLLDDR